MEFPIQYSFMLPILFVALLCFYIYRGIQRGFVSEVLSMISLTVSFVLAWLLAGFFKQRWTILTTVKGNTILDSIVPYANHIAWFIILFILLFIVSKFVAKFAKQLNKIVLIGFVNQIAGAIFAFLKGCIVVMILILLLCSPLFNNGRKAIEATPLTYVYRGMEENVPVVRDILYIFQKIETLQGAKE